MRYGSVCSGIEAATAAWHPLGWQPAFFSDIEAFPRSVLRHHYPETPLHGRDQLKGESDDDYAAAAGFQTIGADEYGPIDLLVGGTPCQSFSIAGLRGGLGDDRGNLALEYLRLADRKRPRWLVWENVPGVLSSNRGRDFGAILGGMAELGYGIAYRILDAQYFGVPQRRRRVFVVGYLGDWRAAAAVLFERHSLSGNPAPSREARQSVAGSLSASAGKRSGVGEGERGGLIASEWPAEVAATMNTAFASKMGLEDQHAFGGASYFVPGVVGSLTAKGPGTYGAPEIDAGQIIAPQRVIYATDGQSNAAFSEDKALALTSHNEQPYVAIEPSRAVRRLTPRECERLQGFPDDYTLIPHRGKPAADGPRYRALGNSMAVPVMRWIGERIQMVDQLLQEQATNSPAPK